MHAAGPLEQENCEHQLSPSFQKTHPDSHFQCLLQSSTKVPICPTPATFYVAVAAFQVAPSHCTRMTIQNRLFPASNATTRLVDLHAFQISPRWMTTRSDH